MGWRNYGDEKVKSVARTAMAIIRNWLKKGNMARAMRDVLPHSGLSADARDEVARVVHEVVRFHRLYDFVLSGLKQSFTPENYIYLVRNQEIVKKYADIARDRNLHSIYLSASQEVTSIMQQCPKLAGRVNTEPNTNISVNLLRITRDNAMLKLRDEKCSPKICTPETCIATASHGRYSSLIKDGFAIVQDSSSQHLSKIVALLGDKILDFCAGSGGKSFTIKFHNPEADIYIHDINQNKIQSLFARAEKLELHFKKFEFSGNFSVVLVDAPCSGLGSAARNPEVKYQSELEKYPKMQMEILNEGKKYVKPSGFIIYSVCTFNPDETYLLVEKFLAGNPDFEEFEIAGGDFITKERRGFFITSGDVIYTVILRRRE